MMRAPLEGVVESTVAAAANISSRIADSPPGQAYDNLRRRLPMLQERPMPTPFGTVLLPEVSPPVIPRVDNVPESIEAMKAAAAIDLSFPISWVPVLGDLVSDVLEDVYAEKLKAVLTPQQFAAYTQHDKLGPSSLAVMRALAER